MTKSYSNENNQKNNNISQINNNFNNVTNKNNNQYSININNNSQDKDKDIKIKDLEEKINILNNKLSKEKNKNDILIKENSELKEKIEQLNFRINNQINNSNIQNKMNELYEKILDLEEKLKRFPFILEKNEQLMSIIFSSVDQKIHYSIVCKNTDKINKLEEELYREYPQFSETDNYFMCKGKVLNKFHSFEKNNIKNGDVIVVNQREY